MGLRDEYDVDQVAVEAAEAYRDAVRAGSMDMGLDDAYRRWRDVTTAVDRDEAYAAALGYTNTLDHDGEALYSFCTDTPLAGYDGLFLSAAARDVPDELIRLPDLTGVDYVGYRAAKTVHVEGGVGDRCGEDLQGGSIMVEGGAGAYTGKGMCGGGITVEEDVGAYCGMLMEDGEITVKGDAAGTGGRTMPGESYLGNRMMDGRITVHGHGGGRIGQSMEGGRIHVRGDAGRRVGQSMGDGQIRVEGEADSNVGQAMTGGRVQVCSTPSMAGSYAIGGEIIIDQKHPDAGVLAGPGWPPSPTDISGVRIFHGTGSSQRQAWPPRSIAEWGENAARAVGEALDDFLNGV